MASPLREAIRNVYLTIVKILLHAGADVNLGGSWDKKSFDEFCTNTPFSISGRGRKVLDLLAAAGAEIIDAEEMMKPVESE